MHVLSSLWCRRLLLSTVLVCAFLPSQNAYSQRVALKTNALEYLILSPNLTLEARLSRKMSLQLGVSANPINTPISNYKLANFRVEPELRYWFNRPMARHFIAFSGIAGAYSLQFNERFIKGDVLAAGISYGYALVLGRHWNVEFEVGAGIASLSGLDYKGTDNVPAHRNMKKVIPVPVRVAVSFGYVFK